LSKAGPGGSAYTEFAAEPPSERASLLREKWGRIVAGIAVIGAGTGLVIGGGAAAKTAVEAKAGAAVAGAVAEHVVPELISPPAVEEPPLSPSAVTPEVVGEVAPDEVLGEGMRYITRRELDLARVRPFYAQQFLELQDMVLNWHLYYSMDTSINPETFISAARARARRLAIEFRNSPRFSQTAFRVLADNLDRLADWAEEEMKLFRPPQRSSSGDH
jgi:hypothetical protein